MPKDRFHAYLDYCDAIELIGVGDYIEMVARSETLAWTFLMRDLMDTYRAGKLVRVITGTGSAAYVRSDCAKLHPSDNPQKYNMRGTPNGNVR